MLCTCCKKIRPHCRQPEKGRRKHHACLVRHHANFDDLINSANQGCELCNLFRPYIEYAQFKNKLLTVESVASDCGSDAGYSGCTEYSQDDLFEDMGGGDYGTVRASKCAGYFDYGDHWSWFDELCDGLVNEEAREKRISMILKKEEGEDKLCGAAIVRKLPSVDNSEIMQWLFQQDDKPVGPEQVWIQGWTFLGEGWPCLTGDLEMMGLGERSTVFSLSVGSIDSSPFGENSNYCVDNRPVPGTVALAYQIPGIWQQKHNSARISTKWTSTARNMQPVFEFYHRRGI
jgi:hypothetical protein